MKTVSNTARISKWTKIATTKTYGGRSVPVFAEIQYGISHGSERPRLSITGVVGPQKNGNSEGGCGQCYPNPGERHWQAVPGIDLDRFLAIWRQWHLNDMRAGCPHQRYGYRNWECSECRHTWASPRKPSGNAVSLSGEAAERCPTCNSGNTFGSAVIMPWQLDQEVEVVTYKLTSEALQRRTKAISKAARAHVTKNSDCQLDETEQMLVLLVDWFKSCHSPPDADSPLSGCYEVAKRETKRVNWVKPNEHPLGILTKPCTACGYAYGSAWLYEEIPQDVLEFLEALPNDTAECPWSLRSEP